MQWKASWSHIHWSCLTGELIILSQIIHVLSCYVLLPESCLAKSGHCAHCFSQFYAWISHGESLKWCQKKNTFTWRSWTTPELNLESMTAPSQVLSNQFSFVSGTSGRVTITFDFSLLWRLLCINVWKRELVVYTHICRLYWREQFLRRDIQTFAMRISSKLLHWACCLCNAVSSLSVHQISCTVSLTSDVLAIHWMRCINKHFSVHVVLYNTIATVHLVHPTVIVYWRWLQRPTEDLKNGSVWHRSSSEMYNTTHCSS